MMIKIIKDRSTLMHNSDYPSDHNATNINQIVSIALKDQRKEKFALPLINDNLIMMRMGR